jgi:hypothetical protein
LTPREVARLYRVSPDRVRAWIQTGELKAINTARARCTRPRFIVLPRHLQEFERSRQVSLPTKPPRRRSRPCQVDFYPDTAPAEGAVPHE